MSSKRKWDQPGPADAKPATPSADEKAGGSDAAAAAAAIAAKIAAQYAGGGGGGGSGMKDPHDAEFTHDIDINDVRNRYMLTKGTTQQEIHEETGASVATKGTWYPDRSKATDRDAPLYLHIMAPTQEILDKAIAKVNDLLAIELGSLVDDKKDRVRERRKWPEEKLPVQLDTIRNFNVRAKVVGPSGSFVKYIQQETGTRVQIKGFGSGFIEQETGRESEESLYIHITGPEEGQVARAKVLTEDLLLVVRSEHAKMAAMVQAQQMELHQAQQQYAAYGGYAPPQPTGAAPPPPPGSQPPPPPGGAPPGTEGAGTQEQFAAYWAAYGYDVNSTEFKDWMQQQYGQYYAGAGAAGGAAAQPQPPSAPVPPAPPAPDSAPPPPPPPA